MITSWCSWDLPLVIGMGGGAVQSYFRFFSNKKNIRPHKTQRKSLDKLDNCEFNLSIKKHVNYKFIVTPKYCHYKTNYVFFFCLQVNISSESKSTRWISTVNLLEF